VKFWVKVLVLDCLLGWDSTNLIYRRNVDLSKQIKGLLEVKKRRKETS
jgi:hypothetical protein